MKQLQDSRTYILYNVIHYMYMRYITIYITFVAVVISRYVLIIAVSS